METYLCGLFWQVKGDTLADFGGQLTEHLSLETTNHDLAQPLVQLRQVGRPATVPLPASPKVPVSRGEPGVKRSLKKKKTHLFTDRP